MAFHLTAKTVVYLLAAAVIVFFFIAANPSGLNFLNDDFIHVPQAAGGHFLHSNLLRPVADFTLWLDHSLYGWNPVGFHVTNLVLHLVNTLLAYRFFSIMVISEGRESCKPLAILAALLFLVYAFHAESVFWIIGRGGSLAAFFMLVSLNCYVTSQKMGALLISLAAFVAGLFAYEFVWIMPLIILLFQLRDVYNGKETKFYWSLSFIIVFVLFLLIRLKISSIYFSDYESGSIKQLRVGTLMTNYCATLLRCFLPPVASATVFVAMSVALLIALIAAIWFVVRKNNGSVRHLLLPFLCLLVSCVPSMSLGIDTHDGEGGRFLYVPSLFFCWLIAELSFALSSRAAIRLVLMGAALVFHSWYFYSSAMQYRYASAVVGQSLGCLASVAAADTLIAERLPTQYKGALIFRSGFENAVELTMPGKFKEVKISSASEIFSIEKYTCVPIVSQKRLSTVYVRWDSSGRIYFNEAIR